MQLCVHAECQTFIDGVDPVHTDTKVLPENLACTHHDLLVHVQYSSILIIVTLAIVIEVKHS